MKLNHLGGLVHGVNSRTLRNAQERAGRIGICLVYEKAPVNLMTKGKARRIKVSGAGVRGYMYIRPVGGTGAVLVHGGGGGGGCGGASCCFVLVWQQKTIKQNGAKWRGLDTNQRLPSHK